MGYIAQDRLQTRIGRGVAFDGGGSSGPLFELPMMMIIKH